MSAWTAIGLPLRRRALPARAEADLWLTDLAELPLDAGPNGLNRRERLLKLRIQQQFMLRLLLGSYLGRPGKDVAIRRNAHGKPALAPALALSGLSFNLSHSGSWLAIAVARGVPLGVDIEVERALPRAADLARRYYQPDEAAWLAGLDEPERSLAFLRQWTGREALAKATGAGLARALGGLRLGWSPCAIRALPDGWPEPAQWSLLAPDWPAGLVGHVAAPLPGLHLNAFFLTPARRH